MEQNHIHIDISHHQDSVVELYLDRSNSRVIELHHRVGGQEHRIEHSAQSYLQQFGGYPIGQKVLQAMVSV